MTHSHWRLSGTTIVLGMLASAVSLAQQETFTYDDLGRLVIVDHGDNKSTNYDLDPAGNRKNVQTSDGTPPTVPASVNATAASASQINLTWTASSDNVAVTKYRVERCQGAGCSTFSHIASPTTVTYSDTGLPDITSFTYRAISASQINLTWAASSDNVAVTGYVIQRCTGVSCSNFAQVGTSVNTSFPNTMLADITTYRYRVRARDAIPNFSGWSNIDSATTPDGTAPSTPTGLAANAVAFNQVTLTWNASTDNVAVTGYRVDRCAGSGCSNFAQIATPATNSFTNTPVSGSTVYRYRVRAVDAIPNVSGVSSVVTVTTPSGVPVAPVISPGGLLKKIVGQSYTISWNSVAGATSYNLFDNGSSVWTGTATSRNFPSAVLGDHLYNVKACNAQGCSTNSNGRFVQVCAAACP
jgi:YD repeat-containing protein